MTESRPAFACDLSRLTNDERQRLTDLSRALFAAVEEARPRPDGFALRLPEDPTLMPTLMAQAAEFLRYDHLCCGFLRHALVIEAGDGPPWLELTGPPGAKQAIAGDLARLLRPGVAAAAGLGS
jgi:hypothetical protein